MLIIDQPARLVEHRYRGADGWHREVPYEGAIAVLQGLIQIEGLYRVPPGPPCGLKSARAAG